jgi:hypothetical protein
MAAQRIKRLKDLVDQLERLPPSSDRDRVLSEVRSRAVDLDTGVTPRAMLPVREPSPPPAVRKPPNCDRASSITRRAAPPSPAAQPVRSGLATATSADLEQALCLDEHLSLEDSPLPYVREQGARGVPPWRFGLRA